MAVRHKLPDTRRSHWQQRRATQLVRRTGLLARGLLAAVLLAVLIAGIPGALWHYVGWPLPRHLPTAGEIDTALTSPLTTSLLLNALACVLWTTWALFAIDVVRTAAGIAQDVSRRFHPPTAAGPLQTLAAALIGAIVLALLPSRDPHWAVTVQRSTTAAAAAPFDNAQSIARSWGDGPRTLTGQTADTATTAVVRPPHNGIHDSLWRIADRRLGDGTRWPEIYALNRGRPQADGRTFTNPSLIQPGWTLQLPEAPTEPGDEHEPGGAPEPAPSTPEGTPSPPPSTAPASPAPDPGTPQPSMPTDQAPPTDGHGGEDDPRPGHGVELPGGVFVGTGLAAATAAALLVVRRRRRIRYRPGSGRRDDLHIAPVVRALRRAHDEATAAAAEEEPAEIREPAAPAEMRTASSPRHDPAGLPGEHVIGVREGRALAWDLARSRGLGLIGPGALDAVRALLVDLVSEQRAAANEPGIQLIVPALDARRLLGQDYVAATPPLQGRGLCLVGDMTEALQMMETELVSRARSSDDGGGTDIASGTETVLIASPAPSEERRLQAILDNGSSLGLAGVLIGQWRPGGTLHVRQDGTVSATSPSHASVFTGARLFTLPAGDAQALVDLFAEAAPSEPVTSPPAPVAEGPLPTPEPRRRPRRPLKPPEQREGLTAKTHTDVEAPAAGRENSSPTPATRPTAAQATAIRASAEPPVHSTDQQTRIPVREDRDRAVQIAVLGRTSLTYQPFGTVQPTDITDTLTPRQREVLAYLALHHEGARRESLAATIWPDAPRDRPYNSLHATLSQLRRTLRTATRDAISDITRHDDARYALEPQHVHVDLWDFQEAVKSARESSDDQYARQAALQRAVDLYAGDFADDITAEWAEAPREALRRTYLDSLSTLVRALAGPNPRRALDLLERARELDRHNEAIYRDIARMQARLGQYDAVSRTLELLTRSLAELDETPSRRTVALCEALKSGQATADPEIAEDADAGD